MSIKFRLSQKLKGQSKEWNNRTR